MLHWFCVIHAVTLASDWPLMSPSQPLIGWSRIITPCHPHHSLTWQRFVTPSLSSYHLVSVTHHYGIRACRFEERYAAITVMMAILTTCLWFSDSAAAWEARDPDLRVPPLRAWAGAPLDAGEDAVRCCRLQHDHHWPGDWPEVPGPRVSLGLRQHRGQGEQTLCQVKTQSV